MADLIEITSWIDAVNNKRWPDFLPMIGSEDGNIAEQKLNSLFQTHQTLAVYGTLAPGKPNHHIVAPYGGTWSDGIIRGDLGRVGWGAELNYPGFNPRENGTDISAKLLRSSQLPDAWPAIDEFEGSDYYRILVPVFGKDGQVMTVANVYAACLMLSNQA